VLELLNELWQSKNFTDELLAANLDFLLMSRQSDWNLLSIIKSEIEATDLVSFKQTSQLCTKTVDEIELLDAIMRDFRSIACVLLSSDVSRQWWFESVSWSKTKILCLFKIHLEIRSIQRCIKRTLCSFSRISWISVAAKATSLIWRRRVIRLCKTTFRLTKLWSLKIDLEKISFHWWNDQAITRIWISLKMCELY
jgi:hypothetical protein